MKAAEKAFTKDSLSGTCRRSDATLGRAEDVAHQTEPKSPVTGRAAAMESRGLAYTARCDLTTHLVPRLRSASGRGTAAEHEAEGVRMPEGMSLDELALRILIVAELSRGQERLQQPEDALSSPVLHMLRTDGFGWGVNGGLGDCPPP